MNTTKNRDGIPCPRCGQPTELRAATAKLMRWFYCHNPRCSTKQITRWPQDAWSEAAAEKRRDNDWPTAAWIRLVDDANRTSEAASPIAALFEGDDVVMDALLLPREEMPSELAVEHWAMLM